ncbi:hypothetical protein BDD12DRAFT_881010 [Trichophaea hybrida]|nr:hypothetical protein BDD12DRAFT_881010 [Trichophaea hybrida]
MDIFTDVQDGTFLKGKIFYFPRALDNVKAVAVGRQTGQYLIAIYSVLFTLITIEVWQLTATLVMILHHVPKPTIFPVRNNKDVLSQHHASNSDVSKPSGDLNTDCSPDLSHPSPSGDPNPDSPPELHHPAPSGGPDPDTKHLGMAMAGFWNAREPLNAVFFTTKYLFKACLHGSNRVRYCVFGLFLLSVIGIAASYVSSIFVAGKLVLSTSAPARLSVVFIPSTPTQMNNYDLLRFLALRAPAALQAIGSAEAASVTVRDTVKIDKRQFGSTGSTNNQPIGITYEYSVTGADMGLQKYPELRQEVMGNASLPTTVPRTGEADSTPRVQALAFPYDIQSDPRQFLPVNNSYGIFVFSAGRKSYRGSSDVWYSTQQNERSNTSGTDTPPWVVSPKRPTLSCWQQDTWVYKCKKYKNIYDLSEPSVINFPTAWFTLLQLEFDLPRIVSVMNSAGPSALMSSMTHTGRFFDAESSSLQKDMTRLLVASRISSVHTIRDSIMVRGAADFVVTIPQVLTRRFSIVVAVPSTLFGLMILLVAVKWLKHGSLRQKLAWPEDEKSDLKPNDWCAALKKPSVTPGERDSRYQLPPAADHEV